tara:strand:+ start:142 stop:660 length:519 start_codon:yes stop_codon:yes gene_type:complete
MKKEIFAIPIFEDKVDLDKINLPEVETEPTWDAGVPSSFSKELEIPKETYKHLSDIINKNLYDNNLLGANPKFGHIWYNRYNKHHYQDAHIHPNCQWSFIIYVDLQAKTSFLNPSMPLIQNQLGNQLSDFPLDYKPDLGPGSIIIFPSFLMHMVNSGNEGTTISGNIYMDYQ